MTDQELERRLAQALSHSAPDDLEGVLSRCETRKGNVIPMKKKKIPARRWLAAACLALVLVGGGSGLVYQQAYAVASVVSLDVNPSIELNVNRNEKVLSCTPLNEDAAAVLADMGGGADLKGTKLDVAVNAIVGALVRSGYFDQISSAILISVEDKDQDRAARLQQELASIVDSLLQDQAANAAVLSQTVTQDAQLEQQAQENKISTGKAALVNQALAINGALQFDELAALSVEELKDLIEAGVPAMPIGKAAALQAAEEYAGTLAADSVTGEADPELDERPACYEVELRHPTLGKFEYQIDAYTGAVLSGQAGILNASGGNAAARPEPSGSGTTAQPEPSNSASAAVSPAPSTSGSAYIGESKAKTIALTHAGVSESAVKYCNSWLEYENGRPECYQVEFEVNGIEYEYEIGLYDGAVLSHESETHTSSGGASAAPTGAQTGSAALTADEAKAIALAQAGVQESQTTKMEVEQEDKDGRPVYEVEFKTADAEYQYKIDGTTGAVLKYDVDRKD